MKRLQIVLLLVASLAMQPIMAQYSRGMSRHYRYNSGRSYGDMVEVTVREPGTLEERMPKEMQERVRILRIEGPLNERDLAYITKLAKRSKVLNAEGKSIDNYLDVDLEYADVLEKNGSRYNYDIVPRRAFEYASHLRSIVLPERVKSIGNRAFASCYDLEEVVMPPRVVELGEGAFEGCDDLRYFSVPERLERIGERCFKGCTRLTRIDLPRNLHHIGKNAMDDSGVTELYIPARCEIEEHTLGEMPQLQRIDVDRDNSAYSSYDHALYDGSGRQLILFPPARTGSCEIPDGVETIGNRAFYKSRLSEIKLPNTLTRLGRSAFAGCSRLTSLWLPDGVAELPDHVMEDCTSLRSVDLAPISLIGESAFRGCSSLQSIKLEGSLTVIAKTAFENCRNLSLVELSPSIVIIEEKAFHECNALREINLSDVRHVGKQAFDRSSNLTAVDLHCATVVEEKAFYECTSLSHVSLGDALTSIGKEAFRRCKSLVSLSIPGSVSSIGQEALRECSSLRELHLSDGLSSLGNNALRETAIGRLILPSTVVKLGKKVCEKCKNLQRLECHAPTPPELDAVSNDKIELYVPVASVEAYKNAKNWKNFKVIKGL